MESFSLWLRHVGDVWGPRGEAILTDGAVAIVVLTLGLMIAKPISRIFRSLLNRSRGIDPTVQSFLVSLVRYGLIITTVILSLVLAGVTATSLIAILGAAGLAVGLALQGTLSDVAAGVVLLTVRPFRIGDTIEIAGGIQGQVKDMTLFTVELATPDGRKVIIPNSKVWGGPIINLTAYHARRIEASFILDNSADIERSFDILLQVARTDKRVSISPEPQIILHQQDNIGITLHLWAWTQPANIVALRNDLQRQGRRALAQEGIAFVKSPLATSPSITTRSSSEPSTEIGSADTL